MTQCLDIAAVCFRDSSGALLIVRKRDTQSFMLPGGKIEPAESPRDAAIREVAEELGIACDPTRLELLGRWGANAANESDTTVDAHVFVSIDRIAPVASAEIEEIRWISLDGSGGDLRLAPLLVEHVIPALLRRI
ncbi:MAG: NUDIX domain-containing protein [Acidimicrobiales bacterium]